jgi:hypothetical protein
MAILWIAGGLTGSSRFRHQRRGDLAIEMRWVRPPAIRFLQVRRI